MTHRSPDLIRSGDDTLGDPIVALSLPSARSPFGGASVPLQRQMRENLDFLNDTPVLIETSARHPLQFQGGVSPEWRASQWESGVRGNSTGPSVRQLVLSLLEIALLPGSG